MKTLFPLLVAFLFMFDSCRKSDNYNNSGQNSQSYLPSLPSSSGTPISINVDLQQKGVELSPNFLGLSFEMKAITQNDYFNSDNKKFIQLIRNLGPGVLRIGAGSVDEATWLRKERNSSASMDTIYATDVDRFAAFTLQTGWPVIFGLNFGGNFDPAIAANEATYVRDVLATNLHSIEFGNEIELYATHGRRPANYDFKQFLGEWDQYYAAIQKTSPYIPVSGPVANKAPYFTSFTTARNNLVNLLTIHYYQDGPGSDPAIDLSTLLSPQADINLGKFAASIKKAAGQTPFRIDECNSLYGGGKPGVSDVFGASLWAINYMWKLAANGCAGVNFHTTGGAAYTPIAYKGGLFSARPEYYSMLLFRDGSSGNMVSTKVDNTKNANVNVYSCLAADSSVRVTIINKESTTDVAATVHLSGGSTFTSVALEALAGPSLTAKDNITVDGQQVGTDGSIHISPTRYQMPTGDINVTVPAASAMLLIFRP